MQPFSYQQRFATGGDRPLETPCNALSRRHQTGANRVVPELGFFVQRSELNTRETQCGRQVSQP
jgi:hypothetical protein